MKDLPPVAQKFILHWGEMGTRWGINRTVAQVHALLFLSENPLPASVSSRLTGEAPSIRFPAIQTRHDCVRIRGCATVAIQ